MHLIRTSSVNETQKLIEFIKPLTKGKIVKDNMATPRCEILPLDLDLVVKKLVRFRLNIIRESLVGKVNILEGIRHLNLAKTYTSAYYLRKLELAECDIDRGSKATNSYVKLADFFDATYDETFYKEYQKTHKELGTHSAKNRWPSEKFSTKNKLKNLNLVTVSEKKFRRLFEVLSNDDTLLTKVTSVEYSGKSDVYDLTVDKAHHFVANGIVVHNCKHLVALAEQII